MANTKSPRAGNRDKRQNVRAASADVEPSDDGEKPSLEEHLRQLDQEREPLSLAEEIVGAPIGQFPTADKKLTDVV